MRTESSSPLASALARLRAQAVRARRWVASRGPIARMTLLVFALTALAVVGYLATPDTGSQASWAWIFENRHLSRDDVARIRETLEAQGIPTSTDRSGRVGVKPERKADALAALTKSKITPPTLDELDRAIESPGLFDGPDEIARRERDLLQKSLKTQIEALDPSIDSAYVRILRTRPASGFRGSETVSGFVNLRVNDNLKLHHKIIEGIQAILIGLVPELKPDAITVLDQNGRTYLVAGNRELKDQVNSRVREELWRDAIHENLRHIPGVDVRVQLEVPTPPPVAAITPVEPALTEFVRPNVPLAVPSDIIAEPVAPVAPPRPRANVWVRVPRSFYLMAIEAQTPNKRPNPEDQKALEATTKITVDHAVKSVIASADLGEIDVYTVQDDLAQARPASIVSSLDNRVEISWTIVSGAIGALGVLVGATTLHLLAARRPSTRQAPTNRRADFATAEEASTSPGPSERVRELIRLDPEAAAGALQRWIGQGEATG